MRQVHIETFGCQMNEYDTELVRALLKKAGYGFTEDRECADVILMNTCAIRENAHTKVYTHLSDLGARRQITLVPYHRNVSVRFSHGLEPGLFGVAFDKHR